ncbi:conserved Plasmodium protein, unknown function [Plasmodium gallinaceum]|uniref:Fam-m protein n=1 Tax=Plasmodium gallinaceum TaxID=5849 RepID=A0A1J1GM48_PLAGA|nr:conserved Plasmodium protein, unknown function [Plasmodium gallinaceum]CRG93309.1 conserved Plasmodium protein, unknown function [Plasmodium gallinaceum]
MKLFVVTFFYFIILNTLYAKDGIYISNKREAFRNKFKKKSSLHILNNDSEKNFLQVKSENIYDPSIVYRGMENNALGISTIYYSRLMWGGVIFLVMFILVSSIGVYLYVDNLEYNSPKKRGIRNTTNYYVTNPHFP